LEESLTLLCQLLDDIDSKINSYYIHIETILEKLTFNHINSMKKCLYD